MTGLNAVPVEWWLAWATGQQAAPDLSRNQLEPTPDQAQYAEPGGAHQSEDAAGRERRQAGRARAQRLGLHTEHGAEQPPRNFLSTNRPPPGPGSLAKLIAPRFHASQLGADEMDGDGAND